MGSIAFKYFEGRRRLDAFYYVMITVTGVGYGDITPHTDAWKILAVIFASVALPLYVFTTSILITKGMGLVKKNKTITSWQRIIVHYGLLVLNPYNQFLLTPHIEEEMMKRFLPTMKLSYGTDPEAYCLESLVQRLGIRGVSPTRFAVRSTVDMQHAHHHVYNIYQLRIDNEADSMVSWEKEHLSKAYQRISLDDIRNDRDDLLDASFRQRLKSHKEQLVAVNALKTSA